MFCPKCQHEETQVVDSRETNENRTIRRRRQCKKCDYRFTTFERVENYNLMVVKKDQTVESYDREKLKKGIWKACEKRPVHEAVIEKLITNLEEKWAEERREEITSKEIGEEVLKQLKGTDLVACVRFASVYRQFKDIETFERELHKLLQENGKEEVVI